MDVPGDVEVEADHGRFGGYLCGQRLRDWSGDRMEQIVVMRKLNLSERRDSFKKQEAVQEVSFDEPDDRAPQIPAQTSTLTSTRPAWMTSDLQSEEECDVRRKPLVPQIAVQGSDSEEADEWQFCSDEEEEEGDEKERPSEARPDACMDRDASAATHEIAETATVTTSTEKCQSPEKGKLKER